MKLTQQLEKEVLQVYYTYWDWYMQGETGNFPDMLPDKVEIIGTTEEEVYHDRESTIAFFQNTANDVKGRVDMRNRDVRVTAHGELILVTEQLDLFIRVDETWNFYSKARLSSLLKKEKDGWKLLHQHGSVPDARANAGETIGFDQVAKENIELRQAVKQRTAELEQKNRELEIEAAMERVRFRTMAMHKSDELASVVNVIFHEFRMLQHEEDLKNTSRGFITSINEEKQVFDLWITDIGGSEIQQQFVIDFSEATTGVLLYDAWKNQKPYIVNDLSGDKLDQWLHYLESVNFKVAPALWGTRRVNTFIYYSQGFIGITSSVPLGESDMLLLQRFARVFEQTYTRFLDLQKAEAQAREAQVETALERVRASAMAMHRSEQLKEVSHELRVQMGLLGAKELETCAINLYEEATDKVMAWGATLPPGSHDQMVEFQFSFSKKGIMLVEEMLQNYYAGEEECLIIGEGERVKQWMKVLQEAEPDLFAYVDEFNHYSTTNEFRAWWSLAFFQGGSLIMITMSPPGHEARALLKRFAQVFGLAYRRFSDLKNAEAQAREAQIEASLERVRSRAMAMHSSQDLADTIGVFYHELHSFSITPRRCGVGLLDKEDRIGELFTWNTTEDGHSLELVGKLKMEGHPVLEAVHDHWVKQQEYHPVLRGNEIRDYYRVIRPQINFPDYTHDDVQFGYFFFFREGGVYAWTQQPMKEDELQIYRRFTSVLSLTYKRYKDLQQAEANTREAQIEAALERVRSRTMAMHRSEELAETAAVVFRQLIDLGIEPNRLYIGIAKEETGDMEMWATDEDGSKVGPKFIFNEKDNASVKKLYDSWKAGQKSTIVDMQGKELENYFDYLTNTLHIPFKGGLSQKRRVQTVAFFGQGFIGVASPEPLTDDTIKLLERFAAVFNLTYTRFHDLQIAEAHAVQAEEDLQKLHAEKKKTEEALSELQATQKQLVQSEKMASLGELTAGIAHEIQNPLNFVNNFSEVSAELIEEMLDEVQKGNYELAKVIAGDVKQNLEKINHHGKRADGIVKGMLQHSRTSSGQKESVDINALCDEYLRLAYHGLRAKDKSFNAKFETVFDSNAGRIEVMPQEIGRVILNLINNAFYAVNDRKKRSAAEYQPVVEVRTQKTGEQIRVSVKDNGTGIPQRVLDKIFQPFFTTKPTGEGTGLGLSLSYDIVKAHGGELQVNTKEGEGTTFIITLPVR